MNIAFIPARGGSKRLPGKNLSCINNIPMVAYSIIFATISDYFDRIIVSTDEFSIAEVSKKYGAEVLIRPDELSGDFSPTKDSLLHCIQSLGFSERSWIFTLQPTNPFREKNLMADVDKLLKRYDNSNSILSVSKLERKFGELINDYYWPKNYKFGQRSQDIPKLYFENGLLYGTKCGYLLETNEMLEPSPLSIETDLLLSTVDIDTQHDLEIAEIVWEKRKETLEYLRHGASN